MSGGYCYGEPEPKERCPYCSALCCADFVDVGVGYIQCGPYHCERCGASEIGPSDDERLLTDREQDTGWYAPGTSAGSSANVDAEGKHIRHFEADTLYRESLGVEARYDEQGRLRRPRNCEREVLGNSKAVSLRYGWLPGLGGRF